MRNLADKKSGPETAVGNEVSSSMPKALSVLQNVNYLSSLRGPVKLTLAQALMNL
jgi:hypothetical protein